LLHNHRATQTEDKRRKRG